MNKIGLKLWNINTDYYFDEAVKLYRNNIFDYIELYIVPNHLDLINKWKTIDIPFDIHAPHFRHKINLSKREFFDNNLNIYNEVKLFADELNANVIVYHGGISGDYKETASQLLKFNDNRIIIENKPYMPLNMSQDDYCVGAKKEEIEYIINNAKCGFCLDIGHAICAANSLGVDPYGYIKNLLNFSPKRIHLSDIHIDTVRDEHLHYGNGTLDFKRIISILPKDINITIETNKDSKVDLNDYKNDVEYLKGLL